MKTLEIIIKEYKTISVLNFYLNLKLRSAALICNLSCLSVAWLKRWACVMMMASKSDAEMHPVYEVLCPAAGSKSRE